MIVITGDCRGREAVQMLKRHGWGRMFVKCRFSPYQGEPWAFDNGAFVNFLRGEDFNAKAFMRRLEVAYRMGRPLFGVVPDIVAAGAASLAFSCEWRESAGLPNDWPWYLAVQDGMAEEAVAEVLPLFDGVFLGGTARFKGDALRWAVLAREHGKKFHYARAGTLRKLEHARLVGADSCDSAFPLWTKARLGEFVQMWLEGPDQYHMGWA